MATDYYVDADNRGDSGVVFFPWDEHPFTFYTTKVKTSAPRKKFAALRAAVGSVISIQDESLMPTALSFAYVRIINNHRTLSPNYNGVLLESKSLLTGAANMSFATLGERNGEFMYTVPGNSSNNRGRK